MYFCVCYIFPTQIPKNSFFLFDCYIFFSSYFSIYSPHFLHIDLTALHSLFYFSKNSYPKALKHKQIEHISNIQYIRASSIINTIFSLNFIFCGEKNGFISHNQHSISQFYHFLTKNSVFNFPLILSNFTLNNKIKIFYNFTIHREYNLVWSFMPSHQIYHKIINLMLIKILFYSISETLI